MLSSSRCALPTAHRLHVGCSTKHALCQSRDARGRQTRHAGAQRILINLVTRDGMLQVHVNDDGVGIDPARRFAGLGLRGIDERVKELGGTMSISRGADRGTTLTATIPVPASDMAEDPRARAAG